MKNTSKIANLFLGLMFLFLGACQPKTEKEEPKEDPKEMVKPPKQIISLKESKSLYDNYSENRVEAIQKYESEYHRDENFKPSRYTAFDYDTMKQYMAFIEQEAKKAKVDISTIRFYFATYPDKRRFPDGQRVVHPRQNSLFMLPTMKVKGINYGFYIGADGEAKLVKDAVGSSDINDTIPNNGTSKASLVPSFAAAPLMNDGQSLTLNHGNSSPPPTGDF